MPHNATAMNAVKCPLKIRDATVSEFRHDQIFDQCHPDESFVPIRHPVAVAMKCFGVRIIAHKAVRVPTGIAIRVHPGIAFAFSPERPSRFTRNPVHLHAESAEWIDSSLGTLLALQYRGVVSKRFRGISINPVHMRWVTPINRLFWPSSPSSSRTQWCRGDVYHTMMSLF